MRTPFSRSSEAWIFSSCRVAPSEDRASKLLSKASFFQRGSCPLNCRFISPKSMRNRLCSSASSSLEMCLSDVCVRLAWTFLGGAELPRCLDFGAGMPTPEVALTWCAETEACEAAVGWKDLLVGAIRGWSGPCPGTSQESEEAACAGGACRLPEEVPVGPVGKCAIGCVQCTLCLEKIGRLFAWTAEMWLVAEGGGGEEWTSGEELRSLEDSERCLLLAPLEDALVLVAPVLATLARRADASCGPSRESAMHCSSGSASSSQAWSDFRSWLPTCRSGLAERSQIVACWALPLVAPLSLGSSLALEGSASISHSSSTPPAVDGAAVETSDQAGRLESPGVAAPALPGSWPLFSAAFSVGVILKRPRTLARYASLSR